MALVLNVSISGFSLSSFLTNHSFSLHESCTLRLLPFSRQMLSEDSIVLCQPGHSELSVCVDTCIPRVTLAIHVGLSPNSSACPWQQVAVSIQPSMLLCALGAGTAAGAEAAMGQASP